MEYIWLGHIIGFGTKNNKAVKDDYERIKLDQPFTPILTKYCKKRSFVISLLNTRSLNKHVIDIATTVTFWHNA